MKTPWTENKTKRNKNVEESEVLIHIDEKKTNLSENLILKMLYRTLI